jgi:hypothetical protein
MVEPSPDIGEEDCEFDQELTLVGSGPKGGKVNVSWSIFVSNELLEEGEDVGDFDEDGHIHEDFNPGEICVPLGCEQDFSYEARFKFELFDEDDNAVASGKSTVSTFIPDCRSAEDQTLEFVAKIKKFTLDGFLQLKTFMCTECEEEEE